MTKETPRLRRAVVGLTLMVVATASTACTSNEERPHTRVFVAGDPTTIGRAWLDVNLRSDLQAVVDRCAKERCTLYLDRVAESSAARARRQVVDFTIPAELAGDPDAVDAFMAARGASAMKVASAAFSTPGEDRCTDIVGAVSAAGEVLRSEGEARRLVLLSGGFQTCPPNLLTAEASDGGTQALVQQLRSARLLPDLRGVDVWMAGAGTVDPDEPAPPPERVEWVKSFWHAYFESAGARLVAWGPKLDRYPR